ncbi:MAG: FeoB-associated Cys-rich membrane protein [Eubacteriales bacterium]|nr:FeoB-associated Cys-rich membrane protein [Eubacteriales bacterium]
MATFIAALIVLLLVALAARYVIRAKKKGQVCIGCPHAGSCSKHSCSGSAEQ